jgi:hypothetical protein
MPVKRRAVKGRMHKITAEAREIFRSSGSEQIVLFSDGAGLVCNPKLARALNLAEYVTYPNMRSLAAELSHPPLDEGTLNYVRPPKIPQ